MNHYLYNPQYYGNSIQSIPSLKASTGISQSSSTAVLNAPRFSFIHRTAVSLHYSDFNENFIRVPPKLIHNHELFWLSLKMAVWFIWDNE